MKGLAVQPVREAPESRARFRLAVIFCFLVTVVLAETVAADLGNWRLPVGLSIGLAILGIGWLVDRAVRAWRD